MKRIILMVLSNILIVPYLWINILHYTKHTDEISDEKKKTLLKKIVYHANKGGRVRIVSSGQEKLPQDEAFIMFPNHQGMYDVLALIDSCPYFFSLVAKIEVKDIPFLKQIIKIMQGKYMDRGDVRQSMRVISEMTEEVKGGRNYLIFPEGTRSKKGNRLLEFKGGSFKSAVKAKCPIVPVALIDSFQGFDSDSIKPITVQVHYLEPLTYEEYKDLKTVEIAEIVKQRIEKCIAENEKSN